MRKIPIFIRGTFLLHLELQPPEDCWHGESGGTGQQRDGVIYLSSFVILQKKKFSLGSFFLARREGRGEGA